MRLAWHIARPRTRRGEARGESQGASQGSPAYIGLRLSVVGGWHSNGAVRQWTDGMRQLAPCGWGLGSRFERTWPWLVHRGRSQPTGTAAAARVPLQGTLHKYRGSVGRIGYGAGDVIFQAPDSRRQ